MDEGWGWQRNTLSRLQPALSSHTASAAFPRTPHPVPRPPSQAFPLPGTYFFRGKSAYSKTHGACFSAEQSGDEMTPGWRVASVCGLLLLVLRV